MLVWRLCRRKYQAFDGEGARHFGGRWNPTGTRVVYASSTLSLAALELFVHLDPDLRPNDLVAISAEIPDRLQITSVEVSNLPKNWRVYPAPESLQEMGLKWLQQSRTAVLAVPSVVVPHERNLVLNPAHPDFRRIRVISSQPFSFDPRMWK